MVPVEMAVLVPKRAPAVPAVAVTVNRAPTRRVQPALPARATPAATAYAAAVGAVVLVRRAPVPRVRVSPAVVVLACPARSLGPKSSTPVAAGVAPKMAPPFPSVMAWAVLEAAGQALWALAVLVPLTRAAAVVVVATTAAAPATAVLAARVWWWCATSVVPTWPLVALKPRPAAAQPPATAFTPSPPPAIAPLP